MTTFGFHLHFELQEHLIKGSLEFLAFVQYLLLPLLLNCREC